MSSRPPAPGARGREQLPNSLAAGSLGGQAARQPRPHLAGGPGGRTTARPPARTPPGSPPASRPALPGAAAPAVPPQPLPRALRRPRRPQPEPPPGGTRRRAAAPLPDSPRAAQPPQRPATQREREPGPASAAGSSRRSAAQRGTLAEPSPAGAAIQTRAAPRPIAGGPPGERQRRRPIACHSGPAVGRASRAGGQWGRRGKQRRRGKGGGVRPGPRPLLGAGSLLGARSVPAGGGGGARGACLGGRAASRGSGGVVARAESGLRAQAAAVGRPSRRRGRAAPPRSLVPRPGG